MFRNKNSNDSDEDRKPSKCLKISNNTKKLFKPYPIKLKTATVAPFRHFGPPNQNVPKMNPPKENPPKMKKPKSPTFAPPTIRPPTATKLNRMSSTRSEDSTYGFANRYSDSKSYFRTTNVDSTIPTITREELFTGGITNEGFKDMMFPLRKSNEKLYPPTIEEENMENIEEEEQVPRKRVKFDEGSIYTQKPKPFQFEVQRPEKTTLRQKIVDFFSMFF